MHSDKDIGLLPQGSDSKIEENGVPTIFLSAAIPEKRMKAALA